MLWLVRLLIFKLWPLSKEATDRTRTLELENLALRQQLAVIQRTSKRPKVTQWDRVFWIGLSRFWPDWKSVCLLVKPTTVVGWHRSGFRLFWRLKSHRRGGRPPITPGLRQVVRGMAEENPL